MFQLYKIWQDLYWELYFRNRYGNSWQWYYLNYEINGEILL